MKNQRSSYKKDFNICKRDFEKLKITQKEREEILAVVKKIWLKVKDRCESHSVNECGISAALYNIQDFLGGIDVDPDGVRY